VPLYRERVGRALRAFDLDRHGLVRGREKSVGGEAGVIVPIAVSIAGGHVELTLGFAR